MSIFLHHQFDWREIRPVARILHFTENQLANEAPVCDSVFVRVLAHMPDSTRQAL